MLARIVHDRRALVHMRLPRPGFAAAGFDAVLTHLAQG